MSRNLVFIVVALAVLGAIIFFTVNQESAPEVMPTEDINEIGNENGTDTPPASEEGVAVAVSHTASGFEPATVTVSLGQTVQWKSEVGNMWVAVDEHPTHTIYSGTTRAQHCSAGGGDTFDQCTTGDMYSFTFTQVGTWDYHNHVAPNQTGTVVVTE